MKSNQRTVFAFIVGKLRRTSKEKRNVQLAQRKFILRSTLQLGAEVGIAFLRYFNALSFCLPICWKKIDVASGNTDL